MNALTINKHVSKLKDWCFKSPTFHIATVQVNVKREKAIQEYLESKEFGIDKKVINN